jgi:hypothetical protein
VRSGGGGGTHMLVITRIFFGKNKSHLGSKIPDVKITTFLLRVPSLESSKVSLQSIFTVSPRTLPIVLDGSYV